MPAYNAYQNNPYVNQYQQQVQQMPQYQQVQNQNIPTVQNNMIWVQGVEGAKAYQVLPGSAVALWDSESQNIYIKVVDASGVPQPLRVLSYKEDTEQNVSKIDAAVNQYVTQEQLDKILEDKFSEFKSTLGEGNYKHNNRQRYNKNNKREVENNG